MNKIIKLKSIEKYFRNRKVLTVSELTVCEGEVIAVLGANGAGKSTLIKIIAGLILQDSGNVEVCGLKNIDRRIHEKVKLVLESGKGYYDYLTAEQNIEYFLKLNNINCREAGAAMQEMFALFDFEPYRQTLVSELSQGNRQKLSLIVALLCQPQVLCLDEPTNGLDLPAKKKLEEILRKAVQGKALTILMTTHDIEFVKNLTNRILLLNKGEIVFDGSLAALLGDKKELVQYTIEILADSEKPPAVLQGVEYLAEGGRIRIVTSDEKQKDRILKETTVIGLTAEPLKIEDILCEVLHGDSGY